MEFRFRAESKEQTQRAFLAGGFEASVVAFTLGAQDVELFESQAIAVDRLTQIVWDCYIPGTATVPFAVVPVLVIARAGRSF